MFILKIKTSVTNIAPSLVTAGCMWSSPPFLVLPLAVLIPRLAAGKWVGNATSYSRESFVNTLNSQLTLKSIESWWQLFQETDKALWSWPSQNRKFGILEKKTILFCHSMNIVDFWEETIPFLIEQEHKRNKQIKGNNQLSLSPFFQKRGASYALRVNPTPSNILHMRLSSGTPWAH